MAQEMVITRKGIEELQRRLEYLTSTRRLEVAEQMKIARSFGDLSENAEYDEARNEQSRLEGEIASLEEKLKSAVVVEDDEMPSDAVGIGTKVTLLDLDENEEEVYSLFGSVESDVLKGLISNESPVGSALMGKKVGEEIEVTPSPGVTVRFRVLKLERAEEEN